jgi:archaemetzincin
VDDLIDAAIDLLPEDAYALVMLVHHDLFEDEDDVFICGRAYGGSRVAVISTARYHPVLDHRQRVERHHAWPASHCAAYMLACCTAAAAAEAQSQATTTNTTKKNAKAKSTDTESLLPFTSSAIDQSELPPLLAAASALRPLQAIVLSSSPTTLSDLWLGRVCRTASHELGHCFGIDHCVYYACSMQGSASLTEDARQPPYLCPVDLAKTLKATGSSAEARYRALLAFCDRRRDTHLFAAFGAWIRARLGEVEVEL